MFGSKRTGGAKSSIPIVKKTGGSKPSTASTTRNTASTTHNPVTASSNAGRSRSTSPQSTVVLSNDPKLLKAQIVDLHKKLDDRDEVLNDMTRKFARKSEECGDLMEERDTVRRRNSIDLQQVTEDYMELQENLKVEQQKVSDMEKNHQEEKECLQLELDVSKGEHELELSMLRKELIEVRNKSEQRGIPMEFEKKKYEDEIRALEDQLREQTQDALNTIEQQKFDLQNQYDQKHSVLVAQYEAEMAKMRTNSESFSSQSTGIRDDADDKSALDSLRNEHEVYVEALKEQYEADLEQLRTELDKMSKKIVMKEMESADDLMSMRNEYETRLEQMKANLEESKEKLLHDNDSNSNAAELLRLEHSNRIEELQASHKGEIQKIRLEMIQGSGAESGDETSKGSMESDLHSKQHLEAYEYEIRNLKAELKKERLEFIETRELLEGNITDMEQDMKEREEKIRGELKEEHNYEIEALNAEHEDLLHHRQKTHKHELAEMKNTYDERVSKELGNLEEDKNVEGKLKAAIEHEKMVHEAKIHELQVKHEGELENLQENLEHLQLEHEELQTEYDLVVGDLASELETTKLKVKGGTNRRSSGSLTEQVENLKSPKEERVQHLTEELNEAKRIIRSLNEEIATFKSQEKSSLGNIDKIMKLEKLVGDLKANNNSVIDKEQIECLKKELGENTKLVEKLQDEGKVFHSENEELRTHLARLREEKETEKLELEEKVSDLQKCVEEKQEENEKIKEKLDNEKERFESEVRNETEQEVSLLKLSYEEVISKLKNSIEELENHRQSIEEENQQLRDDLMELQLQNLPAESNIIANESFSICSENTDMIGDEGPADTKEMRKQDQTMQAIVEDFENKITELQAQLTRANHELLSRENCLQSVNSEFNVLRENLENERNLVQNLEERCKTLMQNHDAEVEKLKKKFQNGAEDSKSEIENQLVVKIEQECEAKVDVLRREHEDELEANRRLSEEMNLLKKQLAHIERQLVEQEAKHLAEELKQRDIDNQKIQCLEEEVSSKNDSIVSMEAERTEHARKVTELEFIIEQLKQKDSNGDRIRDLVDEVQKQQEENASLRLEREAERRAMEEKTSEFQMKERTKSAELDSFASMVETERRVHSQRIEQLDKQMSTKVDAVKALGTMLEKEQVSHEKTIKDTQKHFDKLTETESKNELLQREVQKYVVQLREDERKTNSLEHENARLKTKLREMKAELSKRNKESDDLLTRSKQMTMDELEEVQKLNRSLTEAEIHKGKLLGEMESSKQKLQKTQDKYQKTKEKFKTVKQKWQKDHSKLEEILLSPRVDMGLQTSIIEPEEVEDTKNRLSDSMRVNSRLEGELKESKQDLNGFKNDMQALKRANNVLIKQNQVLYLETEGLKNTVETLTIKMDQLREVSIKLTKDSETFEVENKELKEKLEDTELHLSQEEGERSTIDALHENSMSELEEKRLNCAKYEEDNIRLKNQNDFLLSQAKRLQTKVDELESEVKQLKHDLLVREVEILKNERIMVQNTSFASPDLTSSQTNVGGTDFQAERKRRSIDGDAVSKTQSLKESVGNSGNCDKGYVGIKSYQVIEWDTKKQLESEPKTDTPDVAPTTNEPLDGLQIARVKQLEFDSSNYLGSAYWDTMNFLKTMKASP